MSAVPDLRREDEADGRGQHAGDGEGQHDDAVGLDAQHARHGEVLGRGAHLEAEARALQEGGEADEDDDGDADGDDLQQRDAGAGDLDRQAQIRPQIDGLRPAGEQHQQEMLDDEAEREGGDHHRRRIGVAEAAENEDLRENRQARRRSARMSGIRMKVGRLPANTIGRRIDRRPQHGEDAEGDVVAMGEVDEPHHAEDERDAERAQGIEAAEAQARRR